MILRRMANTGEPYAIAAQTIAAINSVIARNVDQSWTAGWCDPVDVGLLDKCAAWIRDRRS